MKYENKEEMRKKCVELFLERKKYARNCKTDWLVEKLC